MLFHSEGRDCSSRRFFLGHKRRTVKRRIMLSTYLLKFLKVLLFTLRVVRLKRLMLAQFQTWLRQYFRLLQNFFVYVIFNAPLFFSTSYANGFFVFLRLLEKVIRRDKRNVFPVKFPYSLKQLSYAKSNFFRFLYKRFQRLRLWRRRFAGRVISSFFRSFDFLNVNFSVIKNNRMFVPDQLGSLLKLSLKQRRLKKARSIAYGTANDVSKFLFAKRKPFYRRNSLGTVSRSRNRGRHVHINSFLKNNKRVLEIGLFFVFCYR